MAAAPTATPVILKRGRGRPRKYPLPPGSEPPLKKKRYNPPGGSNRNSLFGGSNSLGANGSLTVPRARPSRRHSDIPGGASHHPIVPFPNLRDDANHNSFSTAAATTAALSQSETYKPREERNWEEFHPDLDIDISLPVFSAEDVDGQGTPAQNGFMNGSPILGQALHILQGNGSPINPGSLVVTPPIKRRPGRPPKRPEAILQALGSPAQKITPAPLFNPKERLVLPKPHYRQIETFAAYEKSPAVGINFVEPAFAKVGYQESEIFEQPTTLIRGGKNSLEDENDFIGVKEDPVDNAAHLRVRVEYDMDEQDERWLEVINSERTANGVDMVRPQYFEVAMTLIEKEWHALEKRIPKPNPKPPQTHRPRSSSSAAVNGEPAGAGEEQDSKCAVCDDGDCENTNAIVFCDGCDLAVHQECYGVPFIPEGQWLCRKCQLIGRNTSAVFPHMCIFCPNTEGAFKQTTNMKWSHLLCAFWIPEVSIGNQTFMEPIQDVDKVPKQRWKLTCYICQQKMGACIQCSNKNCYLAFHVTCARRCKLQLKMKTAHGLADKNTLKGFCDKHVPSDWRQEHDCEYATEEAKDYYKRQYKDHRWGDSQQTALAVEKAQEPTEGDPEANDDIFSAVGNNKRKKALLKKIWRLPSGAPIVPQSVFNNVSNILARFVLTKKRDFVSEACKYWTLKREARRGASLLKRLQLQLDTFTSMEMTRRDFAAMGAIAGPKLQSRIEFAENLEMDLERILGLCAKAKTREELKIKDVDLLRTLVDTVYFPIPTLLWPILERVQETDSSYGYFKKGLSEIQTKLEHRFYVSVAVFASDIGQVIHEVAFTPDENVDELVAKPLSEQLNAKDKSKPKATQRERLARAKRVMKDITPRLLDAAAKEAELGVKSVDQERHTVAVILERWMRPPADSPHLDADGLIDELAHGESKQTLILASQTNGIGRHTNNHDADVDMEDFDDTVTKSKPLANGLTTGGAVQPFDADHPLSPSDRETPGLNVPALSNSGSTNPSTTHDPLTPPHDHKDISSLVNGGVPWYHEKFAPNGTTVYEPEDEATPENQLINSNRGISEELSEMDDDAIDGLVTQIEKEKPANKAVKGGLLAVPTNSSPRKKAKPRRRK